MAFSGVLVATLPFVINNFGGSVLLITVAFGLFSFFQFFVSPFWGNLSDKIGRKPLLILNCVAELIANILLAIATSLPIIFLARIIAGLFKTNISVGTAYIADITDEKNRAKGIEFSNGSLGMGLALGIGVALSGKRRKCDFNVYVMLGDGECNEGTTWESAILGVELNVQNLTVIIDYNKWQATGKTKNILNLGDLKKKFQTFGFNSRDINGHNFNQIIKNLKNTSLKKPLVIIAHTIKGKGVSFMEDDNNWHYRVPNKEEVQIASEELGI